ncbi:MAG: hypothetical protein J6T45_07280 [Fibrobacterales bacterium]|nr:hypothetical protein [Fibrobacterales bacterium]
MARFSAFSALCRAFLCAAAVVWAAEDDAAAVSAPPAREVSGAALNEVSALIDSLDYAIRAERDSARREILRLDQRALCAEADDLKRATPLLPPRRRKEWRRRPWRSPESPAPPCC